MAVERAFQSDDLPGDREVAREPMRVRTVFISSRMDELAMERQSSFNAVYEAGLTPILFEVEPRNAERQKIDALVDRADLFLGIYYQSLGSPNPRLCDLCPIEYELYRFLARFLICPKPESRDIHQDDREQISASMNDPAFIRDLTARLHAECKKEAGKLYEIARNRIRLFLRVHEPDNTMSRRLSEFLDGMPRQRFGNASEEPPEVIRFLQERRYIPSHLDLFNKVFTKISDALNGQRIQAAVPALSALILCKVQGKDQPGLIFKILDVCFSKALNIKALSIEKVDAATSSIEVVVLAEPFYESLANSGPPPFESVGRTLSYRLPEYKVACDEAEGPQSFQNRTDQIPSVEYYYEIITFDVPGIIMLVTRLVAHFGANIEFIHFADFPGDSWSSSRYSSLILAVRPLDAKSRIERDKGKTLEYELESLLGVAAVFRRSEEEIQAHFERHSS